MDIRKKIVARNSVKKAVRGFFEKRGYVEVETPSFVVSPDMAPNLSYFTSELQTLDGRKISGALVTSPEYSLKKIVASGAERVYEFARVWRNDEPLDETHAPEFTMLEFYRLGMSFEDGMKETMDFFETVARDVFGRPFIMWKNRSYDLSCWDVWYIPDLFRDLIGIPDLVNPTRNTYIKALIQHKIDYREDDSISDLFNRLFIQFVEPKIASSQHPVVVAHYPRHEASLAKINKDGYAERFEVFIGGLEMCNAYGELTDSKEQRKRFQEEAVERKRLGKNVFPADEELLSALAEIKEPLFGNAIGFDRFLMVLEGVNSIEDVLISPITSNL